MQTFGRFYYEIVEEKMKKSELDTLFEIAKNISPNKSLKSIISKTAHLTKPEGQLFIRRYQNVEKNNIRYRYYIHSMVSP